MANMLTAMDVFPTAAERINVLEAGRRAKQQTEYENAILKLLRPEIQTVGVPAQYAPNPVYMTPGEIESVVGPEAEAKARANAIGTWQPDKSDYYHSAMQDLFRELAVPKEDVAAEREKLMAGVSPEMQRQMIMTSPATTRQEAVPFQPQNYAEAMAMQQHAAQTMQQYVPYLNQAVNMENGNTIRDAVAEQLAMSGNPILARSAEVIKKADFRSPGEVAMTGEDLKSLKPEELKGLGLTPSMVEQAGSRDVYKFKGRVGSMRPVDVKVHDEKKTAEKDITTTVPATPTALQAILDDPNTSERVKADVRQWLPVVRKPTERKLDITKTVRDGEVVGFKATFEPAPQKISVSTGVGGGTDARSIADAIKRGEQPPILTGMSRHIADQVRSLLAKEGFQLAKAEMDWKATQKHLSTLNGPQQERLAQAITFTRDSLPIIEDLAAKWKAGRYPLLNKANLIAAKNGVYGKEAASLATQLDGQINDLVSELATVYKGGNSSTDKSLELAAKNLKSDWSETTIKDNIALIRKNLTIRENSMASSGVHGIGESLYSPKTRVEESNAQEQADKSKVLDLISQAKQLFPKDKSRAQRWVRQKAKDMYGLNLQ